MGVVLYRPGTSHVENGIRCEMKVFPADWLEQKIAEGWETDINALKPAPKIVVKKVTTEAEPTSLDSMSNDEIRKAARLNGYKKWKTARISTLKKFLKG